MGTYAFSVPIVPGKVQAWREFAEKLSGEFHDQAIASRKAAGLDRERAFLLTPPKHDPVAVIVLDTENAQAAFEQFATSNSDIDVWFRQGLKELHGIDMSDENREPPMSELVLDWSADGYSVGSESEWVNVWPIEKGKENNAREFVALLNGDRHSEFVKSRAQLGIKRQTIAFQPTPMGTFIIAYCEGGTLEQAFRGLIEATDPFHKWWVAETKTITGLDLQPDMPTPKLEKLVDLKIRELARV